MTKRIVRILLAAALVMVSFSACHRRPLEEPSGAVRIAIKVDVKTVTNVNANIRSSVVLYGSNTSLWDEKLSQLDPELMRVLVYDPETDKLLTQSFISSTEIDAEGNKVFMGSLGISHGNYNFLVYNFDTPTTQVNQLAPRPMTTKISTSTMSRSTSLWQMRKMSASLPTTPWWLSALRPQPW